MGVKDGHWCLALTTSLLNTPPSLATTSAADWCESGWRWDCCSGSRDDGCVVIFLRGRRGRQSDRICLGEGRGRCVAIRQLS